MNLANLSFNQLFAQAEEIGAKCQNPEEREAIIKSIAQSTKNAAIAAYQVATSEKAIHIYRSIILAIVLTMAVIGIGLYKAAQHYWTEYGQQPTLRLYAYARRRQRIAQWQLSRWIRLAARKGRDRVSNEWANLVTLVSFSWYGL
jgi:hypothetical protein